MPFTFKASNTKAEIVNIKKQKQSECKIISRSEPRFDPENKKYRIKMAL